MASASDPTLTNAFAPAAAHNNVTSANSGGVASHPSCSPAQADGGPVNATTNGAELAAAFTSFLANQPEHFDSNGLPQAVLSNLQLAGILGLLPQQHTAASELQQHGEPPKVKDPPEVPRSMLAKGEEGTDGTTAPEPLPRAEPQVSSPTLHHQHRHHQNPHHQNPHNPHQIQVPGMPPQPRFTAPPTRWPQSAIAAAHWDFAASACGMLSQQQPPGASPGSMHVSPPVQAPPTSAAYPTTQHAASGHGPTTQMPPPSMPAASSGGPPQHPQPPASGPPPASTATTAAGPPPPQQTTPSGPIPGNQMAVHHPGMLTVRGYPYGPYGEPSPYPPHARPPPGPYHHHPAIAGPHGHMLAFHPGFPPMHHMAHRGPYVPYDSRFPPMGPCHHGYPPPGYYRSHPAMPHPHPAYHYMPPPYSGHHAAMHPPSMYHMSQGVPGGHQAHEGHPRDGTASAASAGTGICGGIGSDGGVDPTSAARQAAKVHGSSGGSESEDVGLEAVITLRPGAPDTHEGASGERSPAVEGSEDALAVVPNSCTNTAGRSMSAMSAGVMGPGAELVSEGPPHIHMHKVAQWPHVMPPPPLPHHGVAAHMSGVGNYEWPPPPPPHMMPGYPPMHAAGGWPYPYDAMAAAAMHHQHMMMGEEIREEDNSQIEMHQVQRRRPSQSSLGGPVVICSGMPPHQHPLQQQQQTMYAGMRRPSFSQQLQPQQQPQQHPSYGMPMGAGKAPFGVDPALQHPPGSAEAPGQAPGYMQMQRSGSLGQLFAVADGQCNVSRRTQRLKKRRSADSGQQQQPGSTPDPFIAAMAAAERAAMGRDSSTGSGAQMGLPPMFPGSGGARRSSNGSDRTALQCRALVPANNRQRSDPGYLIENGDTGIAWGLGAMAGLGQLVSYPQQMQMQPNQQQQIRRPSDNGTGGSSRIINLPKRFEDAIMTLEYPRGPHPCYPTGLIYEPYDDTGPAFEEPVYEEEEEEGYDVDLGELPDDSDEDYEAGAAARRIYRGSRHGCAPHTDLITRKRKAPMMREELPQPEKKRKTRDPATISKVVLNCVIILRMVNHELVYEKEIRNQLGNNPDTSKALRLLMNQGKLVRTGQGGRGNPFCYRCTPLGIDTLQRIQDAANPGEDPTAGPNQEQRVAAVAVVRPVEEC